MARTLSPFTYVRPIETEANYAVRLRNDGRVIGHVYREGRAWFAITGAGEIHSDDSRTREEAASRLLAYSVRTAEQNAYAEQEARTCVACGTECGGSDRLGDDCSAGLAEVALIDDAPSVADRFAYSPTPVTSTHCLDVELGGRPLGWVQERRAGRWVGVARDVWATRTDEYGSQEAAASALLALIVAWDEQEAYGEAPVREALAELREARELQAEQAYAEAEREAYAEQEARTARPSHACPFCHRGYRTDYDYATHYGDADDMATPAEQEACDAGEAPCSRHACYWVGREQEAAASYATMMADAGAEWREWLQRDAVTLDRVAEHSAPIGPDAPPARFDYVALGCFAHAVTLAGDPRALGTVEQDAGAWYPLDRDGQVIHAGVTTREAAAELLAEYVADDAHGDAFQEYGFRVRFAASLAMPADEYVESRLAELRADIAEEQTSASPFAWFDAPREAPPVTLWERVSAEEVAQAYARASAATYARALGCTGATYSVERREADGSLRTLVSATYSR